ncbi:hypothetical protein ABOM_005026 [Aspergillus bombycis]|uniref:Major facilitator superfamily (MFS) profile domain-containing protein n=1 Tax=Aspergillus bombycis TaxID=109264 RepID=A0A1F8A539_9EURO|nr:hypothetical protein ABOM_005026 [Aspergillus bombycis]OGM46803.1 hypothetical protein ABOM_005026 [Aspergillus bombycis]
MGLGPPASLLSEKPAALIMNTTTQDEYSSAQVQKLGQPGITASAAASIHNPVYDEGAESSLRIDLPHGVRTVEAVTSVWSKRALTVAMILFYIFLFAVSLQQEVTTNLAPYVTSSFELHSLTATTQVIAGVIGGVSNLPIAKVLDLWGRTEGFSVMTVCCTIGLAMMAACRNVQVYAAAQVLYWVGYNGLEYIISIFIADATSLLSRSVILGISQTPYLGTAFAGPPIAQWFLDHSSFRWAYGMFVITTPIFAAPIVLLFLHNQHKAATIARVVETPSPENHSHWHSLKTHCKSLDLMGMLLLMAGFVLLLLPLSLAARAPDGWRTGYIVAMLVLGVIFLIAFAAWEKWMAPATLLPFRFLTDRSVIGACVVACGQFISFYCWASYLISYLQVVHRLSVQHAGYVLDAYTLMSCFWAVMTGLLIQKSGRFKWLGVCAVPLMLLGTGLLIYFRAAGTPIGYVVMCQILNGVAGSTLLAAQRMAAQAVVNHEEVAVVTALIGLFSSLGAAIGSTIATAIWTNLMPRYLMIYLPATDLDMLPIIYGSIVQQLQYPWGSPTRDAIVHAYGDVQRRLLIAGTCFVPLVLGGVLLWKDTQVKGMKQTKGTIY